MTAATVAKMLGLVLSLGFDTSAVAIGLGLSGMSRSDRFRYGVAFALAEGSMPLVGFALGAVVAAAIGTLASYGAIVLLLAVGLYALWEARHEEEAEYRAASWWSVAALAVSVSLDELAIGFSLGFMRLPVAPVIVLIALQAFLLTLIGSELGARLGEGIAARAELLSGLVLVALALFLAVQKITGA